MFKQSLYLFYKILNFIFISLFNNIKNFPTIGGDKKNSLTKRIHFDLSDNTTHLGDRLFLLPLISSLIQNNYIVTVSDMISSDMCRSLLNINVSVDNSNLCNNLTVYPASSSLRFFIKYRNSIWINFSDKNIKFKLSEQIIKSFSSYFKIDLDPNFKFNANILSNKNNFEWFNSSDKYVIFNNYINSGFFRKNKYSIDLLNFKASELSSLGYKILHVGSINDKNNDNLFYDFVDIDLRGKISIVDLLLIYNFKNLFYIVTFDNFIMHLSLIFNKICFVRFRGRFFKSNYILHINYINNNFESLTKINYL